MVNYWEAVKRAFTDWKKFLIGVLVGLIPMIGSVVLVGYGIEASGARKAKRSRSKKKALPKWENNFWHFFEQGIKAYFIPIIYMIPAVIMFFVVILAGIVPLFGQAWPAVNEVVIEQYPDFYDAIGTETSEAEMQYIMRMMFEDPEFLGKMTTIMKDTFLESALPSMWPLIVIGAVLLLAGLYVTPMAVLNSVRSGRFGDAFALRTVLRKSFTGKYFLAWAVIGILSVIASSVAWTITGFIDLLYVTSIGSAAVRFIMPVIKYDIYWQVYKKVK